MKVSLIDFTGAGTADPGKYAADLLIFAKSTRLTMSPSLLEDIAAWPQQKRIDELLYIANTIPASHEFVHYTFLIEGVSRAFTHQLVRSRQFSYAQQTMRVLNVGGGWTYQTGPSIENDEERRNLYENCMDRIDKTYNALVSAGAEIEDARGVLPTNIKTNILMSGNLRNFCDLIRKRSSSRTQGEYRDFLRAMKREIMYAHPWAGMFIARTFDAAADELDSLIQSEVNDDATRIKMIKLMDQMRGQS